MTKLKLFNEALVSIRNTFHKYGKFSDSNAKLDEIGKLFAIFLYYTIKFPEDEVVENSLKSFENKKEGFLVHLNDKFRKISSDKLFALVDGNSIFGDNPSLDLEMNDDDFSFNILKLIQETHKSFTNDMDKFDFLNEAFGHFIRDNFRSNIEDAQYMTPQEVVDYVCKAAQLEMRNEKNVIVCDPCCGVGSFLRTYGNLRSTDINQTIKLIGQDKVPRMARLSKMNLSLIDGVDNEIAVGNSVIGDSFLDNYLGKVDLILTNPPFGARFTNVELMLQPVDKYPLLNDLFENTRNISSEVLFVDRYLGLLKDGGQLFAVLPDSVISSKGIQEILRYRIGNSSEYEVKSIVELPVETFAQAGTRTKTSVLHIVKKPKVNSEKVFIAKSNSLGFEVSSRKGVAIKKEVGDNDLIDVFKSFQEFNELTKKHELPHVLSQDPSCVEVSPRDIINGPWTPNHYDASKIQSIRQFNDSKEFELTDISDLLKVVTKDRRKEKRSSEAKCISVLHVVNGDLLDYDELLKYDPKYPGIVCKPGDLLFSKINPRIHRTLVVPDLGFPLTCSSEFEILEAIGDYSNFELKILLSLPSVKKQLAHLTSGTSSSHNRIKTQDFLKIRVPIPVKNTKKYDRFRTNLMELETKYKTLLLLNVEKVKIANSLVEEVYA